MYRLLCALFLSLGLTAGGRHILAPPLAHAQTYAANDICYSSVDPNVAAFLTVRWDNPAGVISNPAATEAQLTSPPDGWTPGIHSAGWSWDNPQHTSITFTGYAVYNKPDGSSLLIRNRIAVNTFNTITRTCP